MCNKYEKREIRKRAKAFIHHCSLLPVLVILQLKNEDHSLYTPWLQHVNYKPTGTFLPQSTDRYSSPRDGPCQL